MDNEKQQTEHLGSSDCSSDDWDSSDDDVIDTECDHCGEMKRCCLTNDPYMREIHPEEENPESYWCYQCWDIRHGDI
jgi:hypothetical protein